MDAKKCDRCGKFYTGDPEIFEAKIGDMVSMDILKRVSIEYHRTPAPCDTSYYLDLCSDCLQQFVDFMEMGKDNIHEDIIEDRKLIW